MRAVCRGALTVLTPSSPTARSLHRPARPERSALAAAAIFVVCVASARVASARTCTWTGNGTNSLFSTSGNWSCGGGPSNGDNIAFTGTSGNAAKSCTISSAFTAGTFTLSSGYPGAVTVSATLTVNSNLTTSTGSLTGASSINLGGNFSNASATTFTNTGTVTLTGTGTIQSGGASFGALTVNASGGTYTLSDGLTVTGALTVSNGTLTAGSSSVTAGSVSLGGGTFNASSGTTQVGGAFSNTGGTFIHNGGTVKLTGSGSFSPGGASSFNLLTIAASGTYTLGSGLLVGGTFSITSGTLAAGTQAISVAGSWSNAGTFTFTAPETVTLTSTSAATITSGGSSFNALTINGKAGTYTQQDALSTTGDLTLTAGTLATSSNNLTVGGNFNITAGAFSGGSGTVNVTGNLAQSGGTYTGGSGAATVAGTVSLSEAVTNGADPTLVGYWPLDETASPAADSSGQGNPLTWNSTPTATTAVPSAITFTDTHAIAMSGTQEYLATSGAISGIPELRPTTITMSAWYKATSVDTNGGEIVSGSNTYGLRLTTAGITVMKRITDNTSQADWIEYRVPETNHLDGNWHQIVGVIVTGTGGGMSAYLDGVVADGVYWVNGSNGPSALSASSTPTATAAAADAIDWDANTETFGFVIGNNPSTNGYHFGGSAGGGTPACAGTACAIDDVRVYNRALNSADVAALVHGTQPGGSTGVLSLSGSLSVTGNVTVQGTGTLTLGSGSSLAIGTGSTLTMDGELDSTGGTIQSVSGSYTFKVGSTSGAAPQLNINGLTVKNTDSNGMWINAASGASTSFTEFDKLAFSNGTGNQLLNISASSLYLTSNGCTFDGSTTYAVKLTAVGTSNPRALFGDATCATNDATTQLCATSEKQDDDANNDGVPDSGNGAVVEFIRAAETDTAGTIVGYPTAAFNWNTFTYYSTYVAFHDASSGSDAIYMRDANGNPVFTWPDPNLMGTNESIVGTPVWTTTAGGTHYLYVAVNGGSSNTGGVYRLVDNGSKLALDTTWPTATKVGYFPCTCTITSDVQLDGNNVYWAATNSGGQRLFGITQADGVGISGVWPRTVTATVTSSAPTLVTSTSKLYIGTTTSLAQLDLSLLTWTLDAPSGMTSITGRVSYGTSFLAATSGTSRLYAGDSSGTLWAVSPGSFSSSNFIWSYAGGSAVTDNYYDAGTDTVQFGTSAGKVVVLTGAGSGTSGVVLNAGYPYTLPNSDSITTAPLYYGGVLVVGSTKGNLYFLDRNTGPTGTPANSVSIIKEVNFGSTESVSTIGFDSNSSRYMVSTSSAADDGRIYYFDLLADPTPGSP